MFYCCLFLLKYSFSFYLINQFWKGLCWSLTRKFPSSLLSISSSGKLQAYLILLCFTFSYFAVTTVFTAWSFVATLCQASLATIFPTAFAHFTSWQFLRCSKLSCYGDLWSVIVDVPVAKRLLSSDEYLFFSNKYFLS